MDEATFWVCLEYRLSGELIGMPEKQLRRWWCDGFIPEEYHLNDDKPRITGRVWMCLGREEQQEWKFALLLRERVDSRKSIFWTTLLPPDDVTHWLAVDPARRKLEIEPGVASPDLE